MRAERIGLPDPVHPDHVAELPSAAGRDARQRVFEHHGCLRRHAEQPGTGQEGIGRRLAGESLATGEEPINPGVKQIGQAR